MSWFVGLQNISIDNTPPPPHTHTHCWFFKVHKFSLPYSDTSTWAKIFNHHSIICGSRAISNLKYKSKSLFTLFSVIVSVLCFHGVTCPTASNVCWCRVMYSLQYSYMYEVKEVKLLGGVLFFFIGLLFDHVQTVLTKC